MKQRIIDLLAMSRFANLPTVWSNVLLAGVATGTIVRVLNEPIFAISWEKIAFMCVAMSCLYLGGCFLNDWHDVDFDQETRPDRPIPSGRWQRRTIFILAISLMWLGAALSFYASITAGLCSLALIACIILYTKFHKIHKGSLVFMASSRLLVYPTTSLAIIPQIDAYYFTTGHIIAIWGAILMGLYIFGISLSATGESKRTSQGNSLLIFGLIFLTLPIAISSIQEAAFWDDQLLDFLPVLALGILLATAIYQLITKHDIGTFVSRSLALIPMVDFLTLGSIALAWMASIERTGEQTQEVWILMLACPILSLGAWALQKIAPAT